jgi:hypothetical protein
MSSNITTSPFRQAGRAGMDHGSGDGPLGQIELNRYNPLVKLLNSRVLDGSLRLAYRWKKRLQSQ